MCEQACQAWGEGLERLPIRPYPDSMLYSKGLYLLPPLTSIRDAHAGAEEQWVKHGRWTKG